MAARPMVRRAGRDGLAPDRHARSEGRAIQCRRVRRLTLGKIDIQGPDSAVLLDRVYCNTFSTVPIGKVRYGLRLCENGFVMDDGTSARLAADHNIMSTTTANASKVMQHLEHARQVLWPQLDVQIVSVSEQWAQYAIAGPNSRLVLQSLLGEAIELSNATFPYLACAQSCGEASRSDCSASPFPANWPTSLPSRRAMANRPSAPSWPRRQWNVTPYGIEALGVMRIEKGHVAGNELNGTTTAADLGLGRMMSMKKDFIGRILAARSGLTDPARPALVGVKPVDRNARLYAGAHFLSPGEAASPKNDQGYLTSVAFSPALGHWIGLGLLSRGPQRHGERIRAYDPLRGGDLELEVGSPVHFDPAGSRLQG